MRPMTSLARLPSLMTASMACRTSSRSGGWPKSHRKAAPALVTTPVIGLVDFNGNRRGELPHRRDAISVRERHLRFAVSPLALAQVLLRLLAHGQIEHEGDALVPTFLEARCADEYGDTAAVFPEVLLLERCAGSGHLQLFNGPCVGVAPFRRRQVRPAYATQDKILSIVSDDTEKRVIGIQNPPFVIPDEDPDDVGVDQTADPRLSFAEIAVKTGVL